MSKGLSARITKLEKSVPAAKVLFAFIGVAGSDIKGEKGVFDIAQEYWDSIGDSAGKCPVDAAPWPQYQGERTRFLGVGSEDDLLVGLGSGCLDFKNAEFIFLKPLEKQLKRYGKELLIPHDLKACGLTQDFSTGAESLLMAYLSHYSFDD